MSNEQTKTYIVSEHRTPYGQMHLWEQESVWCGMKTKLYGFSITQSVPNSWHLSKSEAAVAIEGEIKFIQRRAWEMQRAFQTMSQGESDEKN